MHAHRGFVDVQKAMVNYRTKMQDADFDGNIKKRDFYRSQYEHYKELHDKGVLWEPDF